MERISVVLIVKNEEALLARCLDSVKGADEIIICDTGSTDGTLEVARRYTDKIFTDYTWRDNFAEARNHAKAKATGDWILTIDADEFLTCPFSDVRAATRLAFMAVNVRMTSEYGPQSQFWFPKLFRNSPQVWWEGAVHNHLSVMGEDVGAVTITFGYSPAHANDRLRTLRILEKEVADNPEAVRERFYLGREYFYRRMYEKALPILGRYVQQSRFLPEKADAFLIMSRAYWELRMPDDARDACVQTLIINPHFKEAVLWMATLAGDGSGNTRWQRNADQWKRMAATADDEGVLFLRKAE
jgi:glycosyltransferase involved in cell wall biosynthesis